MSGREVRRYDEQDVVDAARSGDRGAFSELVRAHQDEVYTLALRLVRDREVAADVSQEAFVRAWRAIPRFRADARFSTWMHRITVNTAFSHQARLRRHRTAPLDGLHIDPEAAGIGPERAGESASVRPKIEAALGELSQSLSSVVVLKDVYDWSHADIAEHLGISVTAAKVRLHRGRKALREILWAEAGDQ